MQVVPEMSCDKVQGESVNRGFRFSGVHISGSRLNPELVLTMTIQGGARSQGS